MFIDPIAITISFGHLGPLLANDVEKSNGTKSFIMIKQHIEFAFKTLSNKNTIRNWNSQHKSSQYEGELANTEIIKNL